jgi:hypothetical protein
MTMESVSTPETITVASKPTHAQQTASHHRAEPNAKELSLV